MRVVNVDPRDIHIILDLSLGEVEKILDAADCSKIEITKETPEKIREAVQYYTEDFIKNLDALVENLKNGS